MQTAPALRDPASTGPGPRERLTADSLQVGEVNCPDPVSF